MQTIPPSPQTDLAPSAPDRTGFRGVRLSLRSQLALLCAGLVLPILVFVGFILWQFAAAERARLEGDALDTAHGIAAAVDRELTGLRSALGVLVYSTYLQRNDLESFHRQLNQAGLAEGLNVVLRTPDGQELVNARRPRGEPLPRIVLPGDPEVIASRQPVVSGFFSRTNSAEAAFAITTPVMRDGAVAYLLSISAPVQRLQRLAAGGGVPQGWTVAIIDRQGTILARNTRHAEFAGKPATKDLQENTTGLEGTWKGFTIDGQAVLGAYARSQLSDWRVAVGVRDSDLAAPLRRSLWYMAWFGAALTLLSMILALFFGRRITGPMLMLAERAAALGRGETVEPLPTRLREVAKVGDALTAASVDLRARERERNAAETALRESVALLEAIGASTPNLVYAKDRDGRMIYANPATLAALGMPAERVLGRTSLDFIADPVEGEAHAANDRQVVETGRVEVVDEVFTSPEGATTIYRTTKAPLRDLSGRIIGVAGMSVDMTDQRAMEAALRASEERFRFALEAAGGIGTWDWDVPTDRIHTNDAFAVLFGVDPKKAAEGAPVSAYLAGMHPEDRDHVTAEIERALADGSDFSAEYRVIGLGGATRWVTARGRCYHDEAGGPARFPGVVIDITERKRTEQALAESQRRLQAILDTVPVGIVIAEAPSGRIIGGNPQVERIFGHPVLPSGSLESYREWVCYHPDGRQVEGPEYPLSRALLGQEERPELEVLYQRGDGHKTWVRLIAAPVRDGSGQIVAGVVACLDIDQEKRVGEALREFNATLEQRIAEAIAEREKIEAQLRQAQKMEAVGRLTGGVAHDFNNLLTVVTGNLDMLRRRVEGSGDGRLIRNLDNALEGARRAGQLTHRLLAFSRQSPLQPEVLDLNKIVSGMSELLRRTIGENIAIETVLAGGLWRTEADPNQLESAVLNLAVNARDAMPDGGKLTLETANAYLDEAYAASTNGEVKAGQYVMVSVSDTGTGMTPDVRAKVFEPFFTTKPVGKGTGLGLAQVYGFARQSGGHAAIYSEPGEGTTVKLYFPRILRSDDKVRSPQAEEPVAAPPAAVKGETILVVEDEIMVREFSISVLEEAGYRVLSAEDGPTALRLLEAHRHEIALLFTDVVLTGPMNGRKVADEALKLRPDLKVLFTTGYTRNAIIHHGRLDEGVHLITKPFAAASLAERVRGLLDGA